MVTTRDETVSGWISRNAAPLFGWLGVATLLAYGVFWLWPLWLGRFDPFVGGADYIGAILGYSGSGFVRFVLASVIPALLYLAAMLLLPKVPLKRALPVIVAVTVIAPVLLLTTYPALASDVFGYLMYGRIISEHGGNPYIDTASDFPNDPYAQPVGGDWLDYPAPYGPVWVWVSALVTWLAGGQQLAALLMLKVIVILAHLGVAAFVWLLTRDISGSERRAAWALLAYGWSPLAITHFALDAHNDALMLLFLLAALWLMRRGRPELAFPALALSVLTKFVPLLLTPLFLLAARHQPRRAIQGVVVSVMFAAIFYLPLWDGVATFDSVREQSDLTTSSPLSLLSFYVNDSLLRPVSLMLFGLGYGLLLWRWRSLEARSYAAIVLYLFVLSSWTKGWYFTWALALGAVLGGPALVAAALAGFGVFLQNMTAWGWEMDTFGWATRYGVVFWEWWLTWTLYLPWLLVSGWVVMRRAMRSRRPTRLQPLVSREQSGLPRSG